jgi:hypothetical protein
MKLTQYINESKISVIDKKLSKLYDGYFKELEKVAATEFNKTVKPFLKKRNWVFFVGNGTIWIGPKGGSKYYLDDNPNDKEFKEIDDLLNIEVDGFNMGLGEFMPEYKG